MIPVQNCIGTHLFGYFTAPKKKSLATVSKFFKELAENSELLLKNFESNQKLSPRQYDIILENCRDSQLRSSINIEMSTAIEFNGGSESRLKKLLSYCGQRDYGAFVKLSNGIEKHPQFKMDRAIVIFVLHFQNLFKDILNLDRQFEAQSLLVEAVSERNEILIRVALSLGANIHHNGDYFPSLPIFYLTNFVSNPNLSKEDQDKQVLKGIELFDKLGADIRVTDPATGWTLKDKANLLGWTRVAGYLSKRRKLK